jgi:hypothetical protein
LYSFLDTSKLDTKGNPLKVGFMDIFERSGRSFELIDTMTNADGTEIDMVELLADVKRHIQQGVFLTTGHSKSDTGVVFDSPIMKTLATFMNFMVPLVLQTAGGRRKNYIEGRVVSNYHVMMLRTIILQLKLLKDKTFVWTALSPSEKKDLLRGVVSYLWSYIIFLSIKHLLGFDDEDDDKFDKVKENSDIENMLLFASMKTLSELEGQGVINWSGGLPVPIITQNFNALRAPQALNQVIKDFEMLGDLLTLKKYKQSNKDVGIHKGDYRFIVEFKRITGFNLEERFNFAFQVKQFYQLNHKGN